MKKIYIYNKKQALFYINEFKVYLLDTGVNDKSGMMYWVFNREETNEAFNAFCKAKEVE